MLFVWFIVIFRSILSFGKSILLHLNTQIHSIEARVYNRKGLVNKILENYSMALEDFNYAIALDSIYDQPYYNRGCIKYYLGNLDDAIHDYNDAIQLNPNSASAYSYKRPCFF